MGGVGASEAPCATVMQARSALTIAHRRHIFRTWTLPCALAPCAQPLGDAENEPEIDNPEDKREGRGAEISVGLDMGNRDDGEESHAREIHDDRKPAHELAID